MHIISNVFDSGGDRVVSGEWGVNDDSKVFNLEVGFVQGFEGAAIVKVVVKWHNKMGVYNGGGECGMLGRRGE